MPGQPIPGPGNISPKRDLTSSSIRTLPSVPLDRGSVETDGEGVLSQSYDYFQQRGSLAAREGTPIPGIIDLIRQAYRDSRSTLGIRSRPGGDIDAVLQATEITMQGYFEELESPDLLEMRVRDHALDLLEEERRRLARELHDETGQILTATLFKIDVCLMDLPPNVPEVETQLKDIRQTLLLTAQDLHRLVYSLRPPMLGELGLIPTLRWHIRQFETQYPISARFQSTELDAISKDAETVIFRVTQEALTNVARHSQARSVLVSLRTVHDQVTLTVEDNGKGFDPREALRADSPSFGLLGMRERARQLGGRIIITSSPGKGTRVDLTLPLAGRPGRH
jgi:signal transduction histidine kinase